MSSYRRGFQAEPESFDRRDGPDGGGLEHLSDDALRHLLGHGVTRRPGRSRRRGPSSRARPGYRLRRA